MELSEQDKIDLQEGRAARLRATIPYQNNNLVRLLKYPQSLVSYDKNYPLDAKELEPLRAQVHTMLDEYIDTVAEYVRHFGAAEK